MGRDRESKRKRSRYDDDRPDMEVLIAHDPMLGLDSSDEDIDFLASLPGGSSSSTQRRRRGSQSSSSTQWSKGKGGGGSTSSKKKKKKKQEPEEDEEVFYVEQIKDKRWNNGRWEYLLAWQGYGPEFDTWEPTSNMDCDDLLQEFEAEWVKRKRYGFDRGETAREIVGMCLMDGNKPMFMVMYKGSDDVEYVPPKECAKYCPNLVIEFYENRQVALAGEDLGDLGETAAAATTAPDKQALPPPPPPPVVVVT